MGTTRLSRASRRLPPPQTNGGSSAARRGCAGVSAATLPATLKLLWTYETGDPIDSSAAIVDGVVYVGAGNGDLLALDLASGKLRWKYATGNLIGESSPAVGPDAVYVGDLGGLVHAVNLRDGKPLWTFKTGAEIKSSPVLVNDVVLIGSYDVAPLRPRRAFGQAAVEGGRPRDRCMPRRPFRTASRSSPAATAVFRAIRVADGTEAYHVESGAYTGASPLLDNGRAYFGTFNYEVLAVDLKQRRIEWRYSDPDSRFPYYSSAALDNGRLIVGGRDKLVHAIDAAHRQAALDVCHTRTRRFVAGGRRRSGVTSGRATGGCTRSMQRRARRSGNSRSAPA